MQELLQERSQDIFNLTIEAFEKLNSIGLDLNGLFVLECFHQGTDITMHIKSSKIEAWKQGLIRKGFITDSGGLTSSGQEILRSIKEGTKLEVGKLKLSSQDATDAFELWWNNYPSTDIFTHKGRKFSGSRGLKVKKEECKLKFKRILNEGKYTAEQLIAALKYEVMLKKENSVKEGENKMRYMQNSLTYLNQGTFENFMQSEDLQKPDSSTSSMIGI